MKIYLSILSFLLLSCSNSKEKPSQNIVTQTVFEAALKEIHLLEANFEINKNNSLKNAKNELTKAYCEVYKKYQISQDDFKKSLEYYSENPEKLERTYKNVLEMLKKENSMVDQQQTN